MKAIPVLPSYCDCRLDFFVAIRFVLHFVVVSSIMRKIDYGSGRNLLQGGG